MRFASLVGAVALLVAASLLAPDQATAQAARSRIPGPAPSSVRVTARTATAEAMDTLPARRIRPTHWKEGALLGGGVGALIGAQFPREARQLRSEQVD